MTKHEPNRYETPEADSLKIWVVELQVLELQSYGTDSTFAAFFKFAKVLAEQSHNFETQFRNLENCIL